jgi:hypothetical protein
MNPTAVMDAPAFNYVSYGSNISRPSVTARSADGNRVFKIYPDGSITGMLAVLEADGDRLPRQIVFSRCPDGRAHLRALTALAR